MRTVALLAGLFFFSGCSISHHVAKDYDEYLANSAGTSEFPAVEQDYEAYRLTPETQAHRYEFRAAASGIANLWVVELGQMLDATLQSSDVQRAFDGLEKAPGEGVQGSLLVFEVVDYVFSDFNAKVALRVTVYSSGQERFSRVYEAVGRSQGGKMFWGGAFATKNAVHQSTKHALDDIVRRLIEDLNGTAEVAWRSANNPG